MKVTGMVLNLAFVVAIVSGCNMRNIAAEKVPSVVKNTLETNYPSLQNVEWEKHNNYFEAEANLNDSMELSLQINSSGIIIMRKQNVGVDKLPMAVRDFVHTNYKEYTIDDVEELEKDAKIYYQVELTGKGNKDINLVLTRNGNPETNIRYWD